ncbi:enoyl-CoA hydratase/isomerase family protein [Pseudonocardia spirodelae]|uniref:Enoyl-CoA hydratase-related protein n=1 Tax=Pseudonocardia spirodelae TaxID=3133431 RepID=A0ABU8T667_9PSEU
MTDALRTSDDANGVREIVLDRPRLLNRFDEQLHHELTAVLLDTARAPGIRAVTLLSTGTAFSAGGDFDLMEAARQDPQVRARIVGDARRLLDAFLELPQPVVVAVQGAAMGLGATVALACDVVVATHGATFADTHVNIGLVAGDGGCLVWPQAVGMVRARRHLLTGSPLDAETAFALGAVSDLASDAEDAHRIARVVAGQIAGLAPLAVQGTKRALNTVTSRRAAEVVDLSLAFEERTLASEDLAEGIAAFRERRPATFRGR